MSDSRPIWTLSGFGDEIDPDPEVKHDGLERAGANHIEVPGAWGVGVVDLDDADLLRSRRLIADRGSGVSAVASPIGKLDLDLPIVHELTRLDRAIAAADALEAPYIRVFSCCGAGTDTADRDAVMRRVRALADRAELADVTLVHENENEIYGDVPERVLDIIESVGSERLEVAWDNANFVQVGVRPFTDGCALLRPHLAYLQVKDTVAETGAVVPAGESDGQLSETLMALREDGYDGFASLEPHLASADALGGFSSPEAFGQAARAFSVLAERVGVDLR